MQGTFTNAYLAQRRQLLNAGSYYYSASDFYYSIDVLGRDSGKF